MATKPTIVDILETRYSFDSSDPLSMVATIARLDKMLCPEEEKPEELPEDNDDKGLKFYDNKDTPVQIANRMMMFANMNGTAYAPEGH